MRHKDDDELKDGVRVPMMMMDSQTILSDGKLAGMHRPGYRYIATDAVAATKKQMAYDDYNDSLTNAWKSPAPGPISATVQDETVIVDAECDNLNDSDLREIAYQMCDADLQNRWRSK